MNPRQTNRATRDKSASFVDLFFDLVFVYSVTQVVGLLHFPLLLGVIAFAVALEQRAHAPSLAEAEHTP